MPQQSLSDFVSAMEAAGMLVRVKDEKRVDELPRVMEDHPTTAVLVEKIASYAVTTSASAGVAGVSTIRSGAAASTTIRGRTIGTIISGHSAGFEDAARREQALWYRSHPCSC